MHSNCLKRIYSAPWKLIKWVYDNCIPVRYIEEDTDKKNQEVTDLPISVSSDTAVPTPQPDQVQYQTNKQTVATQTHPPNYNTGPIQPHDDWVEIHKLQ